MAEGNQTKLKILPSQFAQLAIKIPIAGDIVPLQFTGEWRFFKRIYDTPSKSLLLKCARQVGKSTSAANIAIARTSIVPFFRTLIVHPSAMQSKAFSEDRLAIPVSVSPVLRKLYPKSKQNVLHKRSILKSNILLRYAFLSADRIRGISSDMLIIDEFQDIVSDLVPIMEQTCFRSSYKYYLYSGTPLHEENMIEFYWNNHSTQGEWAIPCKKHGTPKARHSWYWVILGEDNIGKTGIICNKCGAPLDPNHPDAQWVNMQPKSLNPTTITFEAFRIPQMMLAMVQKPVEWNDLLRKREQYEPSRFKNEVMAMPASSGMVPITRKELSERSNPKIKMADINTNVMKKAISVYLGIDWGQDATAKTALALGGYLPGSTVFTYFWFHRFIGEDADPENHMAKIIELVQRLGVKLIGSDYGGGYERNNKLVKVFGLQKVFRYQYLGKQRSGKVVYSPKLLHYIVSRHEVMADFFSAIKDGKVQFPCWEDFEHPYGNDFLAIRSVYNHIRHYIQYDKVPGSTDDCFHAALYCLLASMQDRPRHDILVPREQDSIGDSFEDILAQETEFT